MTDSEQRDNIYHNVLRNALYSAARRHFFERWSRIFDFLVIILGAAAMANALSAVGISVSWTAAMIAIIGALQLIFDLRGSGYYHQEMQRRYYLLLAEIEKKPEAEGALIASWQGQMTAIGATEPPTRRAVSARAYNDAIDAAGNYTRSARLRIPLIHKIFAQYCRFDGYEYQYVGGND